MKKSHFVEIIIFGVLLGALIFTGVKVVQNLFDYGQIYHLVFKDIDSIQIGSPVRIMGVDIGHVTQIHNIYDEIYVDFVVLNSEVKIPPGTVASIQFSGLAGSRSIELNPPSPSGENFEKKRGVMIEEPIRISAAMEVYKSFVRATMVTARGFSSFIGDRDYQEVKSQTQKFRTGTVKLNKDVENLSNNITTGGASFQSNMKRANVVMEHAYNYSEEVNDSVNFQKILSVAKYSKKSLVHYQKLIDRNRKSIRHYALATDMCCQKASGYMSHAQKLYCLNANAQRLEKQLNGFESKITTENIDKMEKDMAKAKTITQKMNNSI